MPEQTDSKPVNWSCSSFRWLLVLYPKPHRREYGALMLQLFRDQCRDAWRSRRLVGLITLWLRVGPDLLKTSLMEHLSSLNQTMFMLKSFRPRFRPFSVFLRIFGAVFLFAVLTSAVVTFMCPETFRSTAYIRLSPNAGPETKLPTEIAKLGSPEVRQRIIQQLNLQYLWGKKYGSGKPLTQSEADARLANCLVFEAAGSPLLVRITAFANTPGEAAKLANGAVAAYREVCQEQFRKTAGVAPTSRSVTLLAAAVPEPRAVRPNKQLNIVLGAMMGILVGLVFGSVVLGAIASLRKRPVESAMPG